MKYLVFTFGLVLAISGCRKETKDEESSPHLPTENISATPKKAESGVPFQVEREAAVDLVASLETGHTMEWAYVYIYGLTCMETSCAYFDVQNKTVKVENDLRRIDEIRKFLTTAGLVPNPGDSRLLEAKDISCFCRSGLGACTHAAENVNCTITPYLYEASSP